MVTEIRVSTEGYSGRKKLSNRSCRDSNTRPFDHESGVLTTELVPLPSIVRGNFQAFVYHNHASTPCYNWLLSLAGAATNITRLLSRQKYASRDKCFVGIKICLSRQNIFILTKRLSRQKVCLWQLPPMIGYTIVLGKLSAN